MAKPDVKPDKGADAKAPAPSQAGQGGYETLDGEESLRYIQAGGRLVSVVRQFPKNPFKPGKRYRFLEAKGELDKLVARSEEG